MLSRSNFTRNFLVAGVLLLVVLSFNNVASADTESINNFNAQINIQKDGGVLVTETINYNFGSNQKHGIFRDIPLTAKDGPQLSINVLGVNNESGQSYQYATSTSGNILHIKIGDANVLVSGSKTYVINYQVYNAIRTFNDHDELYWNVTGNQWPVAIQRAAASVVLPDAAISAAKMDCFTGVQGSTQKNCSFSQNGPIVNYSSTQLLGVGEGLTLVLGMPLGYIQNTYVPPQQSSDTSNISRIFIFFPIFIFISIFIFIIIKSISRRARTTKSSPVIPKELKGQPVVVEYNPPDNLPPIEIGTLLDRRVDITDISSVIMDLAVRGYLKIRYTLQQIKLWPDKKDFELIKLKDGSDLVHPADKIIFKLLFDGRDNVMLSELKKQNIAFQRSIKRIQEETEQHLHNEGYFDQAAEDRSKKMKTYASGATGLLFFMFFVFNIFSAGFGFIFLAIFLAASAVFSAMASGLAHKLTAQGVATLAKILGFREFLQLTEKDKLELLNAPELQPEMFERFLPYAMVLGVEDKWAQKFEGIYNTTPNWYEDPTATIFNSYILASNLMLFNGSFNQVFNITTPRSSSGFGGGGFSGGGSGGGGGGSW